VGQIFHLQKKYDIALKKYREVCTTVSAKIRASPSDSHALHLIPMCLAKSIEIYKQQDDLGRACALLKVECKMLQYLSSCSTPSGHSFIPFLDEMDLAFAGRDPSPQEIVESLIATRRSSEAHVEAVLKLAHDRKTRLENSRWERMKDWAENHLMTIVFGFSIILVLVVVILSVPMLRSSSASGSKLVRNRHRSKDPTTRKRSHKIELPFPQLKRTGRFNKSDHLDEL
jgi:hypothetical protein